MTGQHSHVEQAGMLSEAEFRALYQRLRRRADWGPADRRGALNYITPAEIRTAVGGVRLGQTVTLAAPVATGVTADNPEPGQHQMTRTADDATSSGLSFATDSLAANVHGNVDSHLDALCHVIYDGVLYNGVPGGTVTPDGALVMSVDDVRDGIVGRGVLLDIPRLRGVPWLEPGEQVTADDIIAAEQAQQVQVGRGDLLFVRVGHRLRRDELGPWDTASARAGLHPATLELLAQRQIAVLGSDSNSDTAPSGVAGEDFPVHVLAINALGLHLLDYLQFDDLLPVCEREGRWSFLCVAAPVRLRAGTGSLINPIAIL
jgi:kynurenine formamidase